MKGYVERDGHWWQIVFPAEPGEGMDTGMGPYFTRWGARLALWFHNRLYQ